MYRRAGVRIHCTSMDSPRISYFPSQRATNISASKGALLAEVTFRGPILPINFTTGYIQTAELLQEIELICTTRCILLWEENAITWNFFQKLICRADRGV